MSREDVRDIVVGVFVLPLFVFLMIGWIPGKAVNLAVLPDDLDMTNPHDQNRVAVSHAVTGMWIVLIGLAIWRVLK